LGAIIIRVQFILGKPGTGKTTFCHQEIAAKQDDNASNSLILIVPEQFSFQSEKALISATSGRGLWRAQVLSFHRLSYYVFGKTGGIEKKILEDSGKHMLLRKIIGENKKRLVYFKSGQEKKGFVEALSSSITEFYQYGIEPDEILARADAQTATNLRLKLLDLHLIYKEYKNYLEKEYISSDEILDILAQKIPHADFLRGAEIWLDGFKSFTPQEKTILSALISVAGCVKITLCVDVDESNAKQGGFEKFDAFYEAKDTMRQINEMAESLGAKVDTAIMLHKPMRYQNAPDIAFLCDNFLGFSNRVYTELPKNIRIFSTENVHEEIATCAKTVAMLTRDRGHRYCDIGVVAADLGRYEKYMSAIFSQYDIPVFVDARREIMGHPLVELIFAALEVLATNWQYEAVFRLLRCAMSPIDRQEVDLLENYVLAYNIRGRAWLDGFEFSDDAEFANTLRAKVAELMSPMFTVGSPRKAHRVRDVASALYQFLESNGIDQILASSIADAQMRGDNEALRQHEQIWGKTIGTLDKLVEILGESSETIGDFAKILEEGMADLGLAPPSLDQLVVGDLRRSRFGELKALIVLGANEGLLPSRPETSGLLDDTDRSILAGDGMKLAKDHIAKIYEEQFLIYANFAKPREYLAISYHNGDLEGSASTPTRLIERIAELFPRISITRIDEIPQGSVARIAAPRVVFGDMAVSMATGQLSPIYADAHDFFRGKPEFAAKLRNIEEAAAFSASTHALSRSTTRGLYGRNMRSSVSKLERYINCPFSYFVEYNLEARPRRIYEATPVDMGNIYHDILSQFGSMIQQVGNFNDIDEGVVAEMVDAAIEQTFTNPQNKILESSGKYKHYAQRMRQISRISAEVLARHLQSGDFALAFNEVAFSDFTKNDSGLSLGSIEIPLDHASMLLDGRIDRVDIGEIQGDEYVKIIDYKSGQRQFSLSEVFHGLDMQLLIYLYAFIQKLSEARGGNFSSKILPAAAFYFNLLNPVVAYGQGFKDNPDAIKDEILKNFKMSGIVLEEGDVIYAMDRDLDKSSQIIPVSLKKGSTRDELSLKKESTTISSEGFFALMNHVLSTAQKAGQEILSGNIAIEPAKHRDKQSCRYCDYRSICKFDAAANSVRGGGYRHMQYLKNDEVIARILSAKN